MQTDLETVRFEAAEDGLDLIADTEIAGPLVDLRLRFRGVRESLRRRMEKTVDDATSDKSHETPTDH